MNEYMKQVLQDREVLEELKNGTLFKQAERSIESVAPMAAASEAPSQSDYRESLERLSKGEGDAFTPSAAEAIIMRHGYPSLLVQDGTFETPKLETWRNRLSRHRPVIDKAIASVGRVELKGHPDYSWVGTGWLIDEETIITNRHVAEIFAASRRSKPDIRSGVDASLDFAEEHERTRELVAGISAIIHLEQRWGVDLALLRADKSVIRSLKLQPIPVSDRLEQAEYVATIGYPARDVRNNADDQSRIFEDIYNVKRFAPGKIANPNETAETFTHICTTLGGNSGSTIIDIATGAAVGLHFGGREGQANYAVRPTAILDRAAKANVRVTKYSGKGNGGNGGGAKEDAGAELEGRMGFDPHFLGKGRLATPLPRLNPLQQVQAARTNAGDIELKYTHFSVVMNKTRRLAFYSAVNIDASQLWQKRRGRDKWLLDDRIGEDEQIDNDIYKHNDFDRGHLVRRLDPVWGDDREKASQAEEDTFYYTNAAPQHANLNRKVWLSLEDHVLDRAADADAKVSVFSGPVFGCDDPHSLRAGLEDFQFPLGFWKVIASVSKGRTGRRAQRLDAQAFVTWQGEMIEPDDLELLFGDGLRDEVLQVPITDLERMTGLDFQCLRQADTFAETDDDVSEESMMERQVENRVRDRWLPIRDADDIE